MKGNETMFKIKGEHYYNDFTRSNYEKTFESLEDIFDWLAKVSELHILRVQRQIISFYRQSCINVIVLHLAFQVKVQSLGECRHPAAAVGIEQGRVFQHNFLNINAIIKRSVCIFFIVLGVEDIERIVAKRIHTQ